jgi:hypothetical protein
MGWRVADDPRVVLDVLQPPVAGPAVAHHGAAVRDVAGDEPEPAPAGRTPG